MESDVSMLYKQVFAGAVAVAAVIALAGWPSAQETKKEINKEKAAVSGQDAKYVREIAQANIAEVQAGKLGASKASSDEVKKFAQHMVDDHSKQLAEVRSMAKAKGMQLPSTPAKKHQTAMKNEEALKLVQDTSKNAKDKQLKAAAEKATPVIQKHLEVAKSVAASLK